MSEAESLLPTTTGVRQRKSKVITAARSVMGDTLVEEYDGPQMSKYGHSKSLLTRGLHLTFFPETANALSTKDELYTKGALHWFGISTCAMIAAFVLTGLIPFFNQMNSLIGALFDPLLSFVLPSIMLYKSGLPMTNLDKVGALFYIFVVGFYAWGPGTGASLYSIIKSSGDVGGPFSCQCIAKQC